MLLLTITPTATANVLAAITTNTKQVKEINNEFIVWYMATSLVFLVNINSFAAVNIKS